MDSLLQNVLNRKDKAYSKPLDLINPNLALHWHVCQIATFAFREILALFMRIVASISSLCGPATFGKTIRLAARHLSVGFNSKSQETTPVFLLRPTENRPNREGQRVNMTSCIPESEITDARVKSRTFCLIHKGVKFKHTQGICRGMSDWFLYLYLNTKQAFNDPRAHMAALGKEFVSGGSADATLLQSINLKNGKLLNLKIGRADPGPQTTVFQKDAWLSDPAKTASALEKLPPGAYQVHLPSHATAWVKIHDHLSFFFDPNVGVMEIHGPEQAQQLNKLTEQYILDAKPLHVRVDSRFVRVLPKIEVVPVKLR